MSLEVNNEVKRIADTSVSKAEKAEETSTADSKLKENFSKRDDSSNVNEESGNIDNMLASVKARKQEGKKPSMGLVSDEVAEAHKTAETNNNKANAEAEATMKATKEKTAEADENLTSTKQSADESVSASETERTDVQNNTAKANSEAQSNVDAAVTAKAEAETAYENTKNSLSDAQTNVSEAQKALNTAETDEQKDAAREQVASAEQELQNAQDQEQAAKKQLDERFNAEQTARDNQEEIKTQGEEQVKAAEEKLADTKAKAEASIKAAEDQKAEVEAQGKEELQTAQENVKATKAKGEEDIQTALENAAQEAKEAKENGEYFPSTAGAHLKERKDNQEKGQQIADDINNKVKDSKKLEDVQESLKDVTADNVVDVLESYDKNDGKSLAQTIYDQKGSNKEKIEALNGVQENLQKKAMQYGVNDNDLSEKYYNITREGKLSEDDIKEINKINEEYSSRIRKAQNEEAQRVLDVHNSNKSLKSDLSAASVARESLGDPEDFRNSDYVSEEVKISNIDTKDLFGNGSFDTNSKQLRGNCWNHATIESMTAFDRGQEYVDSLVTKENDMSTVGLPEARIDNNPDNDTFSYTNGHLISASIPVKSEKYDTGSYSIGDGDMAAYNAAVHKYLRNTTDNTDYEALGYNPKLAPDTTSFDGNSVSRGYELISGEKSKTFFNGNIPAGVGQTSDINDSLYESMIEHNHNNSTAFTLDFSYDPEKETPTGSLVDRNDFSKPVEGTPFMSNRHAYSVRGIDKDNIYLGESNNPSSCIKMSREEFLRFVGQVGSFKF